MRKEEKVIMRRTEKLMKEWLFTYKNEGKVLLDLPHIWNALDGQDGGDDYYTISILSPMVNGIDGVMGGTTTFDSMMVFMLTGKDGFPAYENDPVVVNAMREACHHNLYAIANSCGMNGVGPDTTIKVIEPKIVGAARIGAIVFSLLFLVSVVMWILKVKKFKATEEYASYKAFKAELKANK